MCYGLCSCDCDIDWLCVLGWLLFLVCCFCLFGRVRLAWWLSLLGFFLWGWVSCFVGLACLVGVACLVVLPCSVAS